MRDRTFVILATSHYGEPESFGLTRKPFRRRWARPRGQRRCRLAGHAEGGGAAMEDYCHSFEHTVELQVDLPATHARAGREDTADPVRLLRAQLYAGGTPEDDDKVRASSMRWANCASARATSCSGCWAWTWRTWARATAMVRRLAGQGEMAEVEARDVRASSGSTRSTRAVSGTWCRRIATT